MHEICLRLHYKHDKITWDKQPIGLMADYVTDKVKGTKSGSRSHKKFRFKFIFDRGVTADGVAVVFIEVSLFAWQAEGFLYLKPRLSVSG